jgi:hypothetical protein
MGKKKSQKIKRVWHDPVDDDNKGDEGLGLGIDICVACGEPLTARHKCDPFAENEQHQYPHRRLEEEENEGLWNGGT